MLEFNDTQFFPNPINNNKMIAVIRKINMIFPMGTVKMLLLFPLYKSFY